MLGITKEDFAIRGSNFDLTQPWNILRIICGAFMFPHAMSKFVGGALNPGVVGFFAKAGFQISQEIPHEVCFDDKVLCVGGDDRDAGRL